MKHGDNYSIENEKNLLMIIETLSTQNVDRTRGLASIDDSIRYNSSY